MSCQDFKRRLCMINMIPECKKALKEDEQLNKHINGNVFWIQSQTKVKPPYITLFEVSNVEGDSADDEEYCDDIEIQVDVFHNHYTGPVAKEVVRVMQQLGFSHQAQADMYEKDTGLYHKPIQFMITKEVDG